MERLSEREKERIRELVADGSPAWVIHQEINRSRWAIRRYINRLKRPPKREPKRSPLRLSLVEREEISRVSRVASRACDRTAVGSRSINDLS